MRWDKKKKIKLSPLLHSTNGSKPYYDWALLILKWCFLKSKMLKPLICLSFIDFEDNSTGLSVSKKKKILPIYCRKTRAIGAKRATKS